MNRNARQQPQARTRDDHRAELATFLVFARVIPDDETLCGRHPKLARAEVLRMAQDARARRG
jgi:hypothetical protein